MFKCDLFTVSSAQCGSLYWGLFHHLCAPPLLPTEIK